MQLIDTHAHLDDEQFDESRAEVVQRAVAAGVQSIVCVGTTADSSEKVAALTHEFASLVAAVGIQPNYCGNAAAGDWDRVVALTRQPNVKALGETGLDRYWDYTPFEQQKDYFDRHLRLSQKTGLPFVVHMRDCGDEIVTMLQEARRRGPLCGVMHSFTGDQPLCEACLELGLYISFAGMVTFKKSSALREVAANVPENRLLIETDAPYLSPHPKRGQRPNEPALIVHTAQCLAETRGISEKELATTTTQNARQLFGLL